MPINILHVYRGDSLTIDMLESFVSFIYIRYSDTRDLSKAGCITVSIFPSYTYNSKVLL